MIWQKIQKGSYRADTPEGHTYVADNQGDHWSLVHMFPGEIPRRSESIGKDRVSGVGPRSLRECRRAASLHYREHVLGEAQS